MAKLKSNGKFIEYSIKKRMATWQVVKRETAVSQGGTWNQ